MDNGIQELLIKMIVQNMGAGSAGANNSAGENAGGGFDMMSMLLPMILQGFNKGGSSATTDEKVTSQTSKTVNLDDFEVVD